MTSAPVISVRSLRKTYRLGRVEVPVLRGVDVDVQPGEWLAVVGASGSGKSTLLHLMGGLDRPDPATSDSAPGTIRFEGRDLHTFSARELDAFRAASVGFVFQFYHLLPELTVLQNVTIASMVNKAQRHSAEVIDRARTLLAAFNLDHRLAHRPAELSGGERQRVAIARALINQPRVLLADEPTGNLDRATGEKILDALAQLRRTTGQTIVMVTHDEHVAARADRIIRLTDGRVAAPVMSAPAAAR